MDNNMDKKIKKNRIEEIDIEDNNDYYEDSYQQQEDLENEIDNEYNISLKLYDSIKKYLDDNCLPLGEYLTTEDITEFINK